MANNITVTISSNEDIRYSPSPLVRPGDTVTFKLDGIPGQVEVAFDSGSCLTPPGPYTLNGGSLLTSSCQQTVTLNASEGQYSFTATIPGSPESKKRGEHETKKGGLDVTTDPPEDLKAAK